MSRVTVDVLNGRRERLVEGRVPKVDSWSTVQVQPWARLANRLASDTPELPWAQAILVETRGSLKPPGSLWSLLSDEAAK